MGCRFGLAGHDVRGEALKSAPQAKKKNWPNMRKTPEIAKFRNHFVRRRSPMAAQDRGCSSATPAGSCWCCRVGCCNSLASSLTAVDLARSSARWPLGRACMKRSPCSRDASVFARRVLRVSAALRRAAALYADGCERYFGCSHLISLPILSDTT